MVKRKKKIRIPKAYIRVDTGSHTRSIQHPRTGKMMGRIRISKGPGDKTRVRRVSKGKWAGTIQGRTPATYPVRASAGKRGTLRRTL